MSSSLTPEWIRQNTIATLSAICKDKLNAFVWVDRDFTMQFVEGAEKYLKQNKPRLLEGWTIGIKDLFNVKETPLQAGAKILEGYVSPYESTVTERLWSSGAIFVGKQNLDAFGMGSTTTSSVHGPTLNPYTKNGESLSAGGSSGGGAAAVAAGLCRASIGTDTGGSCRQPAAWTGVVGGKLTFGVGSRYGIVAHGSSFDCPGVMAQSVLDLATVFQAFIGFDKYDAQTYNQPAPDLISAVKDLGKVADIKVAIADVGTGIDLYQPGKIAGLSTRAVDISHILEYVVETYYILTTAEAASNLARYDGLRYGRRTTRPFSSLHDDYCKTRSEGFPDEVQRRIMTGISMMSDGGKLYHRGSQIRQWIADQMDELWKQYDVLVIPTTTRSAMTMYETKHASCPEIYNSDRCTTLASLVGSPAVSVPIGLDGDGLPLGMQVIGPPFADCKVLQVAAMIEQGVDRSAKVCS